jgi:enhancer of polycomb-like protein
VEDYESLYPPNRWRDPVSYVKTSETTEETTQDALAHGFTYFMDERDKEWFDKNNEEARGEGTSAQGAVSASGTTTRTSQRSAKAKGKEPDVVQPVVISEDEFELVMGLFEKVTHEKTEFLHHVRCLSSLVVGRAKLISGRRVLSRGRLSHLFPTIKKHSPPG